MRTGLSNHTSGSRVQVDWYLTDNGGQYQVTDVTIGGMNIKVALREQLASKIENIGGHVNASWLVTLASILISISCKLVSDRVSTVFGIASMCMKLPRI